MTTIKNDPNDFLEISRRKITTDQYGKEAQEAQERARTTIIDGSDRLPKTVDHIKGPDKHIHSEADTKAISQAHTY